MVLTEKKLTSEIVTEISTELDIALNQVDNTLKLLLNDCTIPFIARYRKEATGGLDEVQIKNIRDKYEYLVALQERKEAILKSIEEQGKLTPELQGRILACKVKTELEDIYLPFKPKKRTRGQIAKERGLEVPSLRIFEQKEKIENLDEYLSSLVNSHPDLVSKEVVAKGISDFLAEHIAEIPEVRKELRSWIFENGIVHAAVKEEFKDKKTKYTDYYDFREPIKTIASHRLLAIRRAEKEEVLSVTLEIEEPIAFGIIENHIIYKNSPAEIQEFLQKIIFECFARILSTSLETEIRLETRTKAEDDAITVFSKNMRNLLLLPPIPKKMVMGVDPGLRTGSKLVVVDPTGKLLEYTTIYPDHDGAVDSNKNETAREKTMNLLRKHRVECIAIGNGTGCREMETFIDHIQKKEKDLRFRYIVVNESGASVYSASDIAREEFPDLDITYRGAVSIARRLQDPLAELVKIDPKSIGVGQYQHDVNQGKLKRTLEEVVESCVNHVGVNVNTASPSLLSYVSGIGPALGRNIVNYRNQNGEFKSREELLSVPGFGEKTFEQAAGFLRIPGAKNPLDNSAVHPESYKVVEKISEKLGLSIDDFIGNLEKLSQIKVEDFATEEVGTLTLADILKELQKPGRDPREDHIKQAYIKEIRAFDQLQEGQILNGTVTNVTNFGAFVDIGVHQDGLIHISELSHDFIKNVAESISVGSQIQVKVIGVDRERRRISLSKKALEAAPAQSAQPPVISGAEAKRPSPKFHSASSHKEAANDSKKPRASASTGHKKQDHSKDKNESNSKNSPATMSELLSKFNSNRL